MNTGKCSQNEHNARLRCLDDGRRAAVQRVDCTEGITLTNSIAEFHVRFKVSSDGGRVANLHVPGVRLRILNKMYEATCGTFAVEHSQDRHHIQTAIDISLDARRITSG